MSNTNKYKCEIIALETPKILNNCHRCKKTTEFYCSDKFRVNAQQKSIDVWLIYKCMHCDSTWNYTILSRVNSNSIDKDLHVSFMENDRETAWNYAFQVGQLRKYCHGVNTDIRYRVQMDPISVGENSIEIRLVSKYIFDLRIDKLLKEILGVSRTKLYQMFEDGNLITFPSINIKGKLKEDLSITITNFN